VDIHQGLYGHLWVWGLGAKSSLKSTTMAITTLPTASNTPKKWIYFDLKKELFVCIGGMKSLNVVETVLVKVMLQVLKIFSSCSGDQCIFDH
jgi:hypothetical protein